MAEGDQLQALLAAAPGGQLTLSWKATASSPYVYNLGFTQSTPLTDDKTFVAQDKKLGRTEADYKGMGVDTPLLDYVYAGRADGVAFGVSAYEPVQVATKRTEFYTDGGTKWFHFLTSSFPFGEAMADAWRTYPAGSVRTDSWYGGIVAPAAIKNDQGVEQLTAERQGELMGFAPQMWGDDFGHVANPGSFGDEGNLTLRRNGEEIGYSYYPNGVFEVPAEDSAYELEMNSGKFGGPARQWARSTEVKTTWGFRSALDPDTFSVGLPLLFPRVGLPEAGSKTLAASAGQVLPIRVTGHGGYTPGDISVGEVRLLLRRWHDVDRCCGLEHRRCVGRDGRPHRRQRQDGRHPRRGDRQQGRHGDAGRQGGLRRALTRTSTTACQQDGCRPLRGGGGIRLSLVGRRRTSTASP